MNVKSIVYLDKNVLLELYRVAVIDFEPVICKYLNAKESLPLLPGTA
jgi:hypothetical protein